MNSLRKTFLALSLIAVFPVTTMEAFSFPSFSFDRVKEVFSGLMEKAPEVSRFAKENRVSKFAQNNPKKAAAACVLGAAGIAGAGYLAKRYQVGSKIAKVARLPQAAVKSVYGRFAQLSNARKAGVVVGGTVAVVGAAYLAKVLFNKYNATSTVE